MNIKPEGLTLPDCECFREKAVAMNKAIDAFAAEYFILSLSDARALNLCDKSRDYFYAAIIWQMLCGVLNITEDDMKLFVKNGRGQGFEYYREQFEQAYERLKPLIMQRIDYADGVLDSVPSRGNK